jgi:hypothetical protein
MTSGQYIQQKLQAWAARKGLALQGSAGERGARNYTLSVEKNIFRDTLSEATRAAFEAGAGGELRGSIPSMAALHSSAAMAVNLFQYWVDRGDFSSIAKLLDVPSGGIESGQFEDQFPVCVDSRARGFNQAPHLDFALRYKDGSHVGVECKLFEPYGRLDHANLRQSYIDLGDAWSDIPHCCELGKELAKSTAGFNRLGASQLVKHFLGLKFQSKPQTVRLIYLYLDALGDEAAEHRCEIKKFQHAIAGDPVRFVPLSVQEFIVRTVGLRGAHEEYVDYLTERYL